MANVDSGWLNKHQPSNSTIFLHEGTWPIMLFFSGNWLVNSLSNIIRLTHCWGVNWILTCCMRSNIVYLTAISRDHPSKITHAWIIDHSCLDYCWCSRWLSFFFFFFESKAGLLAIISALYTGLDHRCVCISYSKIVFRV